MGYHTRKLTVFPQFGGDGLNAGRQGLGDIGGDITGRRGLYEVPHRPGNFAPAQPILGVVFSNILGNKG